MSKRKNQQGHLPTMEPPKLPVIDRAAQKYAEARDERMAAGKIEKELKEELLALMTEQGLPEYENGDVWVKVESKSSVKVRIGGNESENDDEGEG